jgi:hypothetical protein
LVLNVRAPLGHTAGAIVWLPAIVAGVAGAALVIALHDREAATPLEAVAILLASAAGFALDDPAAEILAASPTTLRRRRITRLALLGSPIVLAWFALVVWQGPASWAETWALTAMFAGLLGLSLSIAGVAARRSPSGRGGVVAAPGLFVLLIASTLIPPRWRPLPMGDVPGGWTPIYIRWCVAAAIGLLVSLWSSRDPARVDLRHRIGRRGEGPRGMTDPPWA